MALRFMDSNQYYLMNRAEKLFVVKKDWVNEWLVPSIPLYIKRKEGGSRLKAGEGYDASELLEAFFEHCLFNLNTHEPITLEEFNSWVFEHADDDDGLYSFLGLVEPVYFKETEPVLFEAPNGALYTWDPHPDAWDYQVFEVS